VVDAEAAFMGLLLELGARLNQLGTSRLRALEVLEVLDSVFMMKYEQRDQEVRMIYLWPDLEGDK
jgi:hypothetical protein